MIRRAEADERPVNPNAYLKTKVMTATPAELRLMLLDGAIKYGSQTHEALLAQDFEAVYNSITRCQNIVLELLSSLRPDHDADLYARLSALYLFMYRRLVDAGAARDATIMQEVLDLLAYERDTWAKLIDRLAEEQGGDSAAPGAPAVAPEATPDDLGAGLGGTVSLQG